MRAGGISPKLMDSGEKVWVPSRMARPNPLARLSEELENNVAIEHR